MASKPAIELNFISYADRGKKSTKRLQRQQIIRQKTQLKRESAHLRSTISSKGPLQWRPRVQTDSDNGVKDIQASSSQPKTVVHPHPKPIIRTTSMRISEHFFFTLQGHISVLLSITINRKDGYIHAPDNPTQPRGVSLVGNGLLNQYGRAIAAGLEATTNKQLSVAIPLINCGFELIKDCLYNDAYSFMFFTTELIIMAVQSNTTDIAHLLLQQIYRMAWIIYGKGHPYSIWAACFSNLLKENPFDTLEAIERAQAQVVEMKLGRENYHSMKWRSAVYRNSYALRGVVIEWNSLEHHLQTYSYLIQSTRKTDMVLSHRLLDDAAHLLLETGQVDRAAAFLGDVPTMVDQYYTEGQKQDLDSTKILLWLMERLGIVLVTQGKHLQATDVWTKAFVLSSDIYSADDPMTLNAMMYLTRSLEALGLEDETSRIQRTTEELIQKYKLTISAEWKDSSGPNIEDEGYGNEFD